ncbi:NlpC/P60 family protein [Bengtsoniella intestinalis]|uniref:C40 family peptidase n=1 Tax=Bengtsoniella intestinalis TaxID=3073143 RepID=UPI00391F0B26
MSPFYKQIKTTALVCALAATCLSTTAMAAPGGQAVAVGATTGSSLNLRSGASTSDSVITQLNKGVAVSILDMSNPDWYQVSYQGKTGYVSTQYLIVDQDGLFTTYGAVWDEATSLYSGKTTDSTALTALEKGTVVTVNGFSDGWYTCTYADTQGYIRSDYLDLQSTNASASVISSSLISYAQQFLGTPYRYGGTSGSGFDCSGFTMTVFGQFGVSLPHSASSQWNSGVGTKVYSVSDLNVGDLVFFRDPSVAGSYPCSHVGIYTGDGQFINASSSQGVSYATLLSGYWGTYFIGGLNM